MATEIERKFLLNDDRWRAAVTRTELMRQGYLQYFPFAQTGELQNENEDHPSSSVRIRIAADKAYLNIKSTTLGIVRQEYDYEIPLSDAIEMLDHLCVGPLIEKTRHFVKYGKHVWEIDEFTGDNAGLIVAEIELGHEKESFERPEWIGIEVSGDARYYNVCLCANPYKSWSK